MALQKGNEGAGVTFVNYDGKTGEFRTGNEANNNLETFSKVSGNITGLETREYFYGPKKDKRGFGFSMNLEDGEEKYKVNFGFSIGAKGMLNALQSMTKAQTKETLFLSTYASGEFFNIGLNVGVPDKDHSLKWKDDYKTFTPKVEDEAGQIKLIASLVKDLGLTKAKVEKEPDATEDLPF